MDVKDALLHEDLDEEIYMTIPPGFKTNHPSKAYRLQKSLYGLK